jgi:hypothetical protein
VYFCEGLADLTPFLYRGWALAATPARSSIPAEGGYCLVSRWFADFYRDIRPNARWDIVKGAVLGMIGLFSWYTSKQAIFVGVPPILIGIAVFTVLAFAFAAVAFGISKFRTKEVKEELPTDDSKQHENCERQIRNLESTISRLRRNDETQGIQISARDGQIEQLNTKLAALQWLTEIALWQSTGIDRHVQTNGWLLDYSLTDEPLFIDFQFSLHSSCVYELSVIALSGTVRIGNRRLGAAVPVSYSPKIESNETQTRRLKIGETSPLTITQPLTREDAVFVLNGSNEFFFDGLFIELQTFPETDPTAKLSPIDSISNKEIREKYPKLDIKFKLAGYFHFVDMHEEVADRNQVITLEVTIENGRKSKTDIDSVQLSVVNIGHPTLQLLPDTGEIYEKKFVETDGSVNTFGKRLKNLAASGLAIIGRGKVSGCFQFSVEDVAIDALTDASVSLTLTDKYGEHHVGHHDLTPISLQ